jgi:hypothetical protein
MDTTINYASYYELIGRNKTDTVLLQLQELLPAFKSELVQLQRRLYAVKKEKNQGTISSENYLLENNQINSSLLAFLDRISKGQEGEARQSLLAEDTLNEAINELIDNQLKFSDGSIRENKLFRRAVGLLFLAAIAFSVIVAYNHFDFLDDKLEVMHMLGANILLYIGIGVLSLYALSLMIRGNLLNQNLLHFSRKTLKL